MSPHDSLGGRETPSSGCSPGDWSLPIRAMRRTAKARRDCLRTVTLLTAITLLTCGVGAANASTERLGSACTLQREVPFMRLIMGRGGVLRSVASAQVDIRALNLASARAKLEKARSRLVGGARPCSPPGRRYRAAVLGSVEALRALVRVALAGESRSEIVANLDVAKDAIGRSNRLASAWDAHWFGPGGSAP